MAHLLSRHLTRECSSCRARKVECCESEDGGQVNSSNGRDDPSEQIQIGVANRREGANNRLGSLGEPSEDQSNGDGGIVKVDGVESPWKNTSKVG